MQPRDSEHWTRARRAFGLQLFSARCDAAIIALTSAPRRMESCITRAGGHIYIYIFPANACPVTSVPARRCLALRAWIYPRESRGRRPLWSRFPGRHAAGVPRVSRSIHPHKCHLCGWIERIPSGTRQNDGLETWIMGAAAARSAWILYSARSNPPRECLAFADQARRRRRAWPANRVSWRRSAPCRPWSPRLPAPRAALPRPRWQ